MIDLDAIRARDAADMEVLPSLEAYAQHVDDEELRNAIHMVRDRRALLAYVDELRKDAERLRGELALIAALQAGDGSTINGPTRHDFGRAFRMAQDIARAAMEGSHE